MKLYFARHGESEANLLDEFSNRGLKHSLTARGREQAVGLAQKLAGVAVTRVFTSPLLRATQTAEIVAARLGAPYQIVDALREYDCGVLEGKSDPTSWAEYQRVQDEWLLHRRWESRSEGGESFIDMRARFVPFIDQVVAGGNAVPGDVLLIAHGGLYRCMLPVVLDNVDFDFAVAHPLANTAAVVAEVAGDKLVCLEWDGVILP